MTTIVTRPASSLTVPSTQNTAPVLDFRCLYTHDLRRKAKRWQDGIARFHTFNKRVMVYDETRNFIGDTHWREPEPIQDGDELQLDKGILIQIGEATGQTIQDISGLFEKRKTAQPASENESPAMARQPPAPAPTATRAAQTAPSQLMPRTLNSVLGTPKGQLGRAALPTKSPFELRRVEGVENQTEERTPKRQRVSYPNRRNTLSSSTLGSKAPSKQLQSKAEPSHQVTECGEIDQNHEQVAEGSRKSAKKPLIRKTISQPQKEYDRSAEKPQANVASGERSLSHAVGKASAPNVRSQGRDIEPSEVINVDSSGRGDLREDTISQGSRLRIATKKPRKKLMYRDLLPRAKENTGDMSRNVRSVNTKESIPKPVAPQIDPLSQFHHEEQDRLKARLQKHSLNGNPTQISDEPDIDEYNSSTLSENECVYISSSVGEKRKTAVNAALEINDPPFYDSDGSLEGYVDNDDIVHNEDRHPSTSPASKLAKMDAVLLRPAKPRPQIHPPPISTIGPKHDLHASRKALSPPPAIPLAPDLQPQPQPQPQPHPPPSTKRLQRSLSTVVSSTTAPQIKRPLRKTVSDTARYFSGAVYGAAGAALPLVPTITEAAPDPWSNEAWELFGSRKEDFTGRVDEHEPG
ncbi:MAG: hypothetical protein Q9195_004405 [Heterodermia aff. obscurata]